MKIKVTKNGPYIVTGNIPLYEKQLYLENELISIKTIRQIDTPKEGYALCRCGHSKTPPFCNGEHEAIRFNGEETAGHSQYLDRAQVFEGPAIDLLDDNRCAYARFCHKEKGDIWTLTDYSSDPENRREAEEAASQCPTGRLTIMLKTGQLEEPDLKPSISIIQDSALNVSAGIFVTGGIPIEDEDGRVYEVRNRAALCRCGESQLKPFCDATHVDAEYQDGL